MGEGCSKRSEDKLEKKEFKGKLGISCKLGRWGKLESWFEILSKEEEWWFGITKLLAIESNNSEENIEESDEGEDGISDEGEGGKIENGIVDNEGEEDDEGEWEEREGEEEGRGGKYKLHDEEEELT